MSNRSNVLLEVTDVKDDEKVRNEDLAYFVRSLHKAFSCYYHCRAPRSEQTTRLEAKLGLYGLETVKAGSFDFEVLFLAHPHDECNWQDARISVLHSR
jgi:hypothetical protein